MSTTVAFYAFERARVDGRSMLDLVMRRGRRARGRARRDGVVLAPHTGMLPEGSKRPRCARTCYALDDNHTALTRELLAKARESVARGGLVADIGFTVAAWLKVNAPDAMIGGICGGVS